MIKSLMFVAIPGLLAGCVSPSGRQDYTGSGALIGGASGAAIGAVADRGSPGAGALIGGAAGLITGGLVGHAMDRQAEAQSVTANPPTYVAPPRQAPPTIADIKAMTKAGVSDDVIINQMKSTRAIYKLDANAIIDLKNSSVSEKVISYMITTSSQAVVSQGPPPTPTETVVVQPPGPDYVWVPGEWIWNGGTWVWIGGRWVFPPHRHAIWIRGHWIHGYRGWYRMPGHWR